MPQNEEKPVAGGRPEGDVHRDGAIGQKRGHVAAPQGGFKVGCAPSGVGSASALQQAQIDVRPRDNLQRADGSLAITRRSTKGTTGGGEQHDSPKNNGQLEFG